MSQRVMLLRVALYTCAQQARGEEAEEFWTLIREIHQMEEASRMMMKMRDETDQKLNQGEYNQGLRGDKL